MQYEILFPDDDKQADAVWKFMRDSAVQRRHIPEINWWVAHYYLLGARTFTDVNYHEGTLDVSYINENGVLEFRYDDIVSKFQSQVGRLLQMDLNPSVERKSVGLDSLRKASITQIALDHAMPKSRVDEMKRDLIVMNTKYGCAGLAVWHDDGKVGIDVVAPWELIPIPANPLENKDVRGLGRIRKVPLEWVKKLGIARGKGTKFWAGVEKVHAPTGTLPRPSRDRFSTFMGTVDTSAPPLINQGGSKKVDKTVMEVVEFAEVITYTSDNYLKDYYVFVGGKRMFKNDYSANRIYPPLWKVNDIDVGGFWGKSFVSTLLPMNVEMEYSVGRMFQNIQDIDAYGVLLEPTTLGMPTEVLRGEDGMKRLRYEPDYTVPDLKPDVLKPVNTGLWPVKAIQMGSELMDKIANQPTELMGGSSPGRVDSQSALGFLYETSNTPLTPTAMSIAAGVTGAYKALLNILQMTWPNEKLIEVAMLDDALAGIVLDPKGGTISLSDSVIPHPDEVTIGVKAMYPKSKEQEKMELMKSLELGIIDAFEYRIEVRKRGLELPAGNEMEWQNYRRSMLENILLFGDGKEPGEVIVADTDMAEVHLRILLPFMSRPEFYAATPEVRNAFKEHYQAHQLAMGIMPDQAPYPEEGAEEVQAVEKMQAQGQGGGQGYTGL